VRPGTIHSAEERVGARVDREIETREILEHGQRRQGKKVDNLSLSRDRAVPPAVRESLIPLSRGIWLAIIEMPRRTRIQADGSSDNSLERSLSIFLSLSLSLSLSIGYVIDVV